MKTNFYFLTLLALGILAGTTSTAMAETVQAEYKPFSPNESFYKAMKAAHIEIEGTLKAETGDCESYTAEDGKDVKANGFCFRITNGRDEEVNVVLNANLVTLLPQKQGQKSQDSDADSLIIADSNCKKISVILAPHQTKIVMVNFDYSNPKTKNEWHSIIVQSGSAYSTFVEDIIERAPKLYSEQKYQESIDLAQQGLRADKTCATLYYLMGLAYQGLNQFDNATKNFQAAADNAQDGIYSKFWISRMYYNKAVIEMGQSKIDEAMRSTDLAIKYSGHAKYYELRGQLAIFKQRYILAAKDLKKAISMNNDGSFGEIDFDYDRLFIWIAVANTEKEETARDELIDYMNKNRKKSANSEQDFWYSSLALLYMDRANDADLIKSIQRGTNPDQLKKQVGEGYFYLGMKRLVRGDTSGAADALEKSVSSKSGMLESKMAKAILDSLY